MEVIGKSKGQFITGNVNHNASGQRLVNIVYCSLRHSASKICKTVIEKEVNRKCVLIFLKTRGRALLVPNNTLLPVESFKGGSTHNPIQGLLSCMHFGHIDRLFH